MPPAQICRFYQKGGCWYGERCRYLHIPVTGGGTSFTRRSSVGLPRLHVPTSRSPPSRRGSEPALSQARGLVNMDLREPQSASNPHHVRSPQRPHVDTDETCRELLQSSEVSQACAANIIHKQESSKELTETTGGAAASEDQEETEAYLQSKEVTCGICMDKVYEKVAVDERRFGILPSCNHSFCLRCIITWRKTKDLQEDVIKACPQCRVKSAFYVPHNYWVEGLAKEALIASFKEKCSKRRCSYFLRHGYCPFKLECIYWHDEARRQTARLLHMDGMDDGHAMQFLDFICTYFTDLHFDDQDDDDLLHMTHGLGF